MLGASNNAKNVPSTSTEYGSVRLRSLPTLHPHQNSIRFGCDPTRAQLSGLLFACILLYAVTTNPVQQPPVAFQSGSAATTASDAHAIVNLPLPDVVAKAAKPCRKLCLDRKLNEPWWNEKQRSSWENGPCLAAFAVKVGVGKKRSRRKFGCDVAHCPRLAIDEDKRQQCNVSSWVELDTDCRLLRFRETSTEERVGVACSADGSQRHVPS